MISFLAYSQSEREMVFLKKTSLDISSRLSDEDLKVYGFSSREKFEEFLQNCPLLDISCVDICEVGGIERAKRVRGQNRDMTIVLIADAKISPASYILPDIMAGSLLLRPFDGKTAKAVLDAVFEDYYRRFSIEDGSKSFVIETRDGRQLVPYGSIVYFESRDKKIYLGTDVDEYCFYDTLDRLEEQLGDEFVRCHRSFIVAKKRIKKAALSKSLLTLDNGCEIPLSRTYKNRVRDALK